MVCEYFYPDNSGGTPTDFSELARSIRRDAPDIEIDVITSKNLYRPSGAAPARLPTREEWAGVHITRLGTPRSNRASTLLRLAAGGVFSLAVFWHLLWRPKHDLMLVVTNPPANGLLGWLQAKLRGVPFLYFVNDLYPDIAVALGRVRAGSLVERVFGRFQRSWLHAASRVVVVGRCMLQRIHDDYGVPARQLAVVRNWADPVQIQPSPRQNSFRTANGLEGFVVLYGGNFGNYMDFDLILAAAGRLRGHREISFVLIGDGARKEEVREKARAAQLDNVIILPPVPRAAMNEVLAAADLCLVPLDERMRGLGSPGKVYTILAAGRPVVALVPEGSEVARIVEEEDCGVYLRAATAESLATAVEALAADPARVDRMGRNGRAALEKRFTQQQAVDAFIALFREHARVRRD